MPETKYIEIYQDGKLVGSEPYAVSDAELELENDRQVVRQLMAKAEGEMTITEIARLVKALIRLK